MNAQSEWTDHDRGRWWLVGAELKRYARVKVIETTIEEIERWMPARIEPVDTS